MFDPKDTDPPEVKAIKANTEQMTELGRVVHDLGREVRDLGQLVADLRREVSHR
jgi:hypothetical protein